jgi:PKD repeat protein
MSYMFPGESPATPMAYDVLALQYLYGARPNRQSADAYFFTRAAIDQYSLDGQLYVNPSLTTKQTIWDSGGYNVVDLSNVAPGASGYRLDLSPLGWLTTGANYKMTSLVAGTVIGPDVSIRQVINSPGNDTIYANADPNVFAGYSPGRVTGVDVIYGADKEDTIDLSGYAPGTVTQVASGSDLVIGFGPNGSLTIKGYYAGIPPAIVFGAVTPTVSIDDVTVVESAGGPATATFSVILSAPATTTESVSYTTADGTAQAGSDYVAASGQITFFAGDTQKALTISVLDDNLPEPDETFTVRLFAPTAGVEILKGDGIGTILNDDLALNQPPVAVAHVSSSSGFAPLTVTFDGNSSSDADGSIASYIWTFGDGGSSSLVNPTHVYNAIGTYTATLTVTDNNGSSNSASLTIAVRQDPDAFTFVSNIAIQLVPAAVAYSPQALVAIHRPDGQPVMGVAVAGRWSGAVKATGTAVTSANGLAVLTTKPVKKGGTITFTVTDVVKSGYTYDASRNVETQDSIEIPRHALPR